MRGTAPLGAVLGVPLLTHGGPALAVPVMALIAGLPDLFLLLPALDRAPALPPDAPEPRPAGWTADSSR